MLVLQYRDRQIHTETYWGKWSSLVLSFSPLIVAATISIAGSHREKLWLCGNLFRHVLA